MCIKKNSLVWLDKVGTSRAGLRGGDGLADARDEGLEGGGQRVVVHERVQVARALGAGVLVQRHGGAHGAAAREGGAAHQRRAAARAHHALLPQRPEQRHVGLARHGAAQQAAAQRVQHDEHVAELRGQRVALVGPPVLAPHHVHLVVAEVPRLSTFHY